MGVRSFVRSERFCSIVMTGLLVSLLPTISDAHIVAAGADGFESGFTHPLTGTDHALAMVAVGLWGAQMGGRSVWTLPVVFPLIMVVGGVLGIVGVPLPGIEIGIALSILALGLAIAFTWKPPEAIALLLIAIFAICHGHAHGAELPHAADPAEYAIGFVVATGMLHLIGVGLGLALNALRGGAFSRAIGALIALAGLYYLVG